MKPWEHGKQGRNLAVGAFRASALLSLILLCNLPQPARADILEHWQTNQVTTNAAGFSQVVYGNGVYIASGSYNEVEGSFYSSADGLQWIPRYGDVGQDQQLTFSQGRFVSVGVAGDVLRSTDGTNWLHSYLPPAYGDLFPDHPYTITFGKGVYVYAGQTNGVGAILASSDGSNWMSPAIDAGTGGPLTYVTYGGGRFIAVGGWNDNFVYISSRGTNIWTRSTNYNNVGSPSFYNGIYFGAAGAGTNFLSYDASEWTPVATGVPYRIGVLGYVNGLFFGQTYDQQLATSLNGTNWTLYGPTMPGASWSSVASNGKQVVAIDRVLTFVWSGIPYYRFNSFVYTSDPLVSVRMTNVPTAKVALSGLVGRNYQIQSTDALNPSPTAWRTNATFQLNTNLLLWTDSTATNSQRFYRGVLLP